VRSGFVESRHRGSVVLLDALGAVLSARGGVDVPVLPRSSNKPLQAVGLLACGWDPDDAQLTLAVASHNGEPAHVAVVRSTLAAAGLDESALQCPPDLPLGPAAAEAVLAEGRGRERILMNCSGKHAGMLGACAVLGADPAGYRDPASPVQRVLHDAVERLAGERVTHVAVDGCGAPQHALTLTGLARAFLALVDAPAGSPERRVADAVRRHPDLLGGTDRDVTRVARAVPGLLVKDGAEGVYAAALPGVGAVALKVEDGATRAATVALVAALGQLGVGAADGPPADAAELARLAAPALLGGGEPVGALRAVG
jgi:L-asparaginase II